jgi:hypothetical protein
MPPQELETLLDRVGHVGEFGTHREFLSGSVGDDAAAAGTDRPPINQ